MARYSLLMEQTDMVTGDFANTSDGLANSQRILEATIENVRAEIGQHLLPILETIMQFILNDIIPAFIEFYEEISDPDGEAIKQIEALEQAWITFAGTFGQVSGEIKAIDVFTWLTDSMTSVIKMATHLGTFVGEIFDGMAKIFMAGFGVGPLQNAMRATGITQVAGAMNAANRAAASIKFGNEILSPSRMDEARRNNININMNINRAQVDADGLIRDINSTLRTNGSTAQLR